MFNFSSSHDESTSIGSEKSELERKVAMTDHNRRALAAAKGEKVKPLDAPRLPSDSYGKRHILDRAIEHTLAWGAAAEPPYPGGQLTAVDCRLSGIIHAVVWTLSETAVRKYQVTSGGEYGDAHTKVTYVGFDSRGHLLRGTQATTDAGYKSLINWRIISGDDLSNDEFAVVIDQLQRLANTFAPTALKRQALAQFD